LFRSAVPVSRTSFHSTGTSTAQENNRFEKKPLFSCAVFVPHLHTVTSCVRRDYYINNTASFVMLRKLRSSSFGSIVSAVPCCFSGCSFAQPLGLAPLALCPKSRNANAVFYFFPNVSRSQYYSPLRKGYVPFPSCGGCSIAATPPLRSSQKKFRKNSIFFTAVLGGVL
jgi:hypothetical protein